MSDDVYLYKDLIERQVKRGQIASLNGGRWLKSYAWTNEEEKEILKLIDFSKVRSVLTVLSSGDYLYSLISKGVKDIDTFDVSVIAEYYALGLKRALIESIADYGEFKRYLGALIYAENPKYVSREIEKLIPLMIEKYQLFWSEIIKYNYDLQRKKSVKLALLNMLVNTLNCFPNRCTYLSDQSSYDRVRDSLSGMNIRHYNVNIFDVAKPLEEGRLYDMMYISNIMDYYHERKTDPWDSYTNYKDFKAIEKKLFNLLRSNGIIVNSISGSNSSIFFQSHIDKSQLQKNEVIHSWHNNHSYDYERCLILTKK